MRILLISTVFPPQNAPASPRIAGFAEVWSGAGEEVTVLTTPKRSDHRGYAPIAASYDIAEVAYQVPSLLNRLRSHDKELSEAPAPVNGRVVHAARARRPSRLVRGLRRLRERTGVFGAARMPDLTDFWVRPAVAWAHGRYEAEDRRPWDAVVSSAGPYTTHLVARRLKRDGLVKFWAADFRDLWTGNEPFTGLFPFTIVERFLERSCLREADLLTTISPPLAARLGVRAKKQPEVIYNGYAARPASLLSPDSAFPADGRRRLVYTGTLYPGGHEPQCLLRAMATLHAARPEIGDRLRLVVAGPKRELWLELGREFHVSQMLELAGEVEREHALLMQRDADALLILDWRKPDAGVVTSKLFEYLPARAPIVVVGGAVGSTIGQIIARTSRGLHLGRDVQKIVSVLRQLVDAPASLGCRGDAGAIEQFDIRRQANRFLELLRKRSAAKAS